MDGEAFRQLLVSEILARELEEYAERVYLTVLKTRFGDSATIRAAAAHLSCWNDEEAAARAIYGVTDPRDLLGVRIDPDGRSDECICQVLLVRHYRRWAPERPPKRKMFPRSD